MTHIASRDLILCDRIGNRQKFTMSIGLPYECDSGEFCCEVSTEEIIFKGTKRAYGVDAIDAIDYAIQLLDLECSLVKEKVIIWPDGTHYNREPVSDKMGWTDLANSS